MLTAADISATTSVVDQITTEAISNIEVKPSSELPLIWEWVSQSKKPHYFILLHYYKHEFQIREEYLEIIDNIQQADPEVVLDSQVVTRSSQRYITFT